MGGIDDMKGAEEGSQIAIDPKLISLGRRYPKTRAELKTDYCRYRKEPTIPLEERIIFDPFDAPRRQFS